VERDHPFREYALCIRCGLHAFLGQLVDVRLGFVGELARAILGLFGVLSNPCIVVVRTALLPGQVLAAGAFLLRGFDGGIEIWDGDIYLIVGAVAVVTELLHPVSAAVVDERSFDTHVDGVGELGVGDDGLSGRVDGARV
jgi:hypothetical protein